MFGFLVKNKKIKEENSPWAEGTRRALLFNSLKMALSLSQPHSSLWRAQQVALTAWMDSEGSSSPSSPTVPSSRCDWQRWQAALKIRPSWASESVPGQLLHYALVMGFQALVYFHCSVLVVKTKAINFNIMQWLYLYQNEQFGCRSNVYLCILHMLINNFFMVLKRSMKNK